jgi:hypothetical protein
MNGILSFVELGRRPLLDDADFSMIDRHIIESAFVVRRLFYVRLCYVDDADLSVMTFKPGVRATGDCVLLTVKMSYY